MRRLLAAAALLIVLSPVARADDRIAPVPEEDRERVGARIREILDLQGEVSGLPLQELEEDDLKEVLKGEIVRLQSKWVLPSKKNEEGEEEPQQRRRVTAFCLFAHPRDLVWVSATDPHYLGNDRLTEGRLSGDDLAGVWYQHMDLPWPVKSRQWVIDVVKTVEVAEVTDGVIWERRWNLVENGEQRAREGVMAGLVDDIDLDDVDGARYLDENIGSWSVIELEENLSMIAYQVSVAMGGWIPDRLAARFAKNALKDLMKNVEENVARMPRHYVAGHDTILAGDGTPIPFFEPETAAAASQETDE